MSSRSTYFAETPLEARVISDHDWEYDGPSDYLISPGNPLSVIGSTNSPRDFGFHGDNDFDQNLQLDLCDSIRAGLDDRRNQSPRWEEAMDFLANIMNDERKGVSTVDFATIQKTRLDKMLSDIVNPGNRPIPTPTGFQSDVTRAERLIRLWRARFREHYFMIDQDRYHDLPRAGRLKDVEMPKVDDNTQGHWTARAFEPLSELEANKFEAGQYIIRQYSHKLDASTERHRVVLTLERVKDQLPMESVIRIPRPSQLDDWKLFEKYEEDMIKQQKGQHAWLDWKMDKAQETIDREQYMRTLAFQTSLELAKVGGASSSLGSISKSRAPQMFI